MARLAYLPRDASVMPYRALQQRTFDAFFEEALWQPTFSLNSLNKRHSLGRTFVRRPRYREGRKLNIVFRGFELRRTRECIMSEARQYIETVVFERHVYTFRGDIVVSHLLSSPSRIVRQRVGRGRLLSCLPSLAPFPVAVGTRPCACSVYIRSNFPVCQRWEMAAERCGTRAAPLHSCIL